MADDTAENWIWADAPAPAGPCVVVDVDGVIANGWHRQHFLQDGQRDWKNFFANAHGDDPIAGSVALLAQLGQASTVVLLTARPHSLREITLQWLDTHGYTWDLLILRRRSDGGVSSPEFKRRSVTELRAADLEPALAFDDDQRNVDMFRAEGIETMYVHSGYYE